MPDDHHPARPSPTPSAGAEGAGRDTAARETVDCAVVVVTHNSAGHLGALLASLPEATEGLSTRTVVVDNASTDGTPEVAGRAGVRCVRAGANLGYAGGINLGRACAGPRRSLLILNPDVVLDPVCVTRLADVLTDSVGVAVPTLLDTEGRITWSLRREPTVLGALGDSLLGKRCPERPAWLSETVRGPVAYGRDHDVDWATGAVLLASAACDEAVGDWDADRFFLYGEETDFFARARARGYRVRFVPGARARHEGGGSGRSDDLVALLAVNRVRYFEKYHGRGSAAAFRAAVTLGFLLRSNRPSHRRALGVLIRRSSWSSLPGGRRGHSV